MSVAVAISSAANVTGQGAADYGPPSEGEFIRVLRDHALSLVDVSRRGDDVTPLSIPGLSMGELQELCRLSRPSIVQLLRRFGPVLEHQDADGRPISKGGDHPRRWAIDPNAGAVLILEVGQELAQVAKCDLYGRVRGRRRLRAAPTADETIADAVMQLKQLLHDQEPTDVVGVAVSLAAPVEQGRGIRTGTYALASALETDPPWDDWELMTVREHLRDRLGWDSVPVVLENDANLSALAEYVWGAGRPSPLRDHRPYTNVVYVEWSRGIGAGLILNCELYRGEGVAGEIGHTVIYDDNRGKTCDRCGNTGCLETVAGWEAILSGRGGSTTPAHVTLRDLDATTARARETGSEEAKLFGDAARQLGRVLGPLIHVLNPQLVIIGGDVGRRAYDVISGPLRTSLKQHTMRPALQDVSVVGPRLADAALLGAAAIVLRSASDEPDRLLAFLQRKSR